MSVERRLFVALPVDAAEAVGRLFRLSEAALARARKAPIGDRVDVLRFERAQTEIELFATAAANAGAPTIIDASPLVAVHKSRGCVVSADSFPSDVTAATTTRLRSWLADGATVIQLLWAFGLGDTPAPGSVGAPTPVASVWRPPTGSRGLTAVRERFANQLATAAEGTQNGVSISPTGVSNSVLTEELRSFAAASGNHPAAMSVPVVYRDGSAARPFPLRGVAMDDDRTPTERILRFSLLSIRHVALDATVDGAWLRNTDVSRIRPAGETDEIAYTESVAQLDRLCAPGPVTVVMYQTGLEPAIVGFYRAVAERLATRTDSLVVLPRYFQEGRDYAEGTAWRNA